MKKNRVIEDWLDGEEVRALAEKLLTPPQEPAGSMEETAYGPEFEGFAGPVAGPISEVRKSPGLEPVKQAQNDSGKVESPVGEGRIQHNPFRRKTERIGKGAGEKGQDRDPVQGAVESPFRPAARQAECEESPVGSMRSMALVRFVGWLKEQIPLEACLVCCGKDQVVFDDLADDRLRRVSRLLAEACRQRGKGEAGPPGAMVVKLAADRVMQVVPVVTSDGSCFASLILPRPLADGGVRAFRKALEKALD